jgi:hypothetical protein
MVVTFLDLLAEGEESFFEFGSIGLALGIVATGGHAGGD